MSSQFQDGRMTFAIGLFHFFIIHTNQRTWTNNNLHSLTLYTVYVIHQSLWCVICSKLGPVDLTNNISEQKWTISDISNTLTSRRRWWVFGVKLLPRSITDGLTELDISELLVIVTLEAIHLTEIDNDRMSIECFSNQCFLCSEPIANVQVSHFWDN